MTDAVDFDATVCQPNSPAGQAFIALPFDVKAVFGRARCPVRVTVNEHTWRTTTVADSAGFRITVGADSRRHARVDVGDRVRVSVRKDQSTRPVEVPAELAAALQGDPQTRAAFEALAPSHRREYARWVGEATRAQTRERRAAAALERLRSGVRRPA